MSRIFFKHIWFFIQKINIKLTIVRVNWCFRGYILSPRADCCALIGTKIRFISMEYSKCFPYRKHFATVANFSPYYRRWRVPRRVTKDLKTVCFVDQLISWKNGMYFWQIYKKWRTTKLELKLFVFSDIRGVSSPEVLSWFCLLWIKKYTFNRLSVTFNPAKGSIIWKASNLSRRLTNLWTSRCLP